MKSMHLSLYFFGFSYGLIMFAFFRLPDRFWETFFDKVQRSYEFSKMWLHSQKEKLPMIGEVSKAEKLLVNMQVAESRLALGIKMLPEQFPRFKFYTALLEQLFENYRRMGTPIKKILPELRKAINSDLKFEKKIQAEIIGAVLQFMVIGLTTWSFVFLSTQLVDLSVSVLILFLMLLLQMIGVLLFFTLLYFLKKKTFLIFSLAFMELYLFITLLSVRVSINEVLSRSKILEGALLNTPLFSVFGVRTRNLITRMKETGLSPKEEAEEILDGLWHFQGELFVKFTKKVQLLKFSVLALFFLPAYFLYLASIFQFFMEQ